MFQTTYETLREGESGGGVIRYGGWPNRTEGDGGGMNTYISMVEVINT